MVQEEAYLQYEIDVTLAKVFVASGNLYNNDFFLLFAQLQRRSGGVDTPSFPYSPGHPFCNLCNTNDLLCQSTTFSIKIPITLDVNFQHAPTVHFLNSQNLQANTHWKKQGPCHNLGSRGGINLKLSPVSALDRLIYDVIFQSLLISAKYLLVCKNTHGSSDQNDNLINQHFRLRSTSGVDFHFMLCLELEIAVSINP